MSRNNCTLYPEVNGEASKLYKDLLKKIPNRPLVNYIYAAYLQQGVAANMSRQGFKTNKQGQHDATAVMQYFDVINMENESAKAWTVAKQIGARDSSGDLVNFTNVKEALEKAAQANHSFVGTVSYVVPHGDSLNILTEAKDSRTQIKVHEIEEKLAVWSVIEQAFNKVGIDINSFDFNKELVNANRGKAFLGWLDNLKYAARNDVLSQKEIRTILALGENSTQVKRLEQMFGSLDEAANKMYDAFHRGRANYTQSQLSLMESAITEGKKFQGLDINALKQQVSQVEGNLAANSEEVAIQSTLETLNQKYNIDFNEIHKKEKEISQLSHVAVEAVTTLERQLRELKAKQGITPEVQQLETAVKRLTKELQSKRYYSGAMSFLTEALTQVQNMESLYKQASQASGTNLERNKKRAEALMQIDRIMKGYWHIVYALSNIDRLTIDENISDYDKKSIGDQAKAAREQFEKYSYKIKELEKDTMIDIATEYLGESTSNGMAIADIVTMADIDSTFWDKLYSISRVSNPLITVMGDIIRNAQGKRTKELEEISLRIRRATRNLYKSGSDSSFMYEPNGNYIISDIDWKAYNGAKVRAYNKLVSAGKSKMEIAELMEQWQEANTEDRIVDYVSGRTERVPNGNYRKAFPQLTQAQQEYYNEMMQIKGELGTLLPKYAQKQYLPPQKRRKFLDAIGQSKGSPKAIAKAILNKLQDLVTIREDDPLNSENGVIDGEEYGIRNGALDNTAYRRIPIFYINRLKDSEELLKDFSGAMQALAGTAINYDCMDEIKDTIEFMGDFIERKSGAATENGKRLTDRVINDDEIKVYKDLEEYGSNSNTSAIIRGFIDKHIYGVKVKDQGKWVKLVQTLLNYTSIRALTFNVKGFIANYIVGEFQMLIEAGAGEFYNLADYAWANARVFGDNTLNAPGRIMDFLTDNVNSKSMLLAQRFDPLDDEFNEQQNKRYYKGPLRKLLGHDFTFIGYGTGEHMLHFVNMYAVLHNIKVQINGKKATLYDAFYTGNKSDGNSELLLKNNVTYKDNEGNWKPVDDVFLDSVRDKVRYCNQTTHGSMNEEDAGLINQRMIGRCIFNLKRWMIEHYSRRFRGSHWDSSLRQQREGYYTTVGKFMLSWANDLFNFESEAALHWKDMDAGQKANVRRALSENLILGCLLGLSFALGEPEEHKKDFWMRMWIYQTKRAIMETKGSTPYGLPFEMDKLINSPIAATNTVNTLLYPFVGLGDLNQTIKSGKYKGWNKYGRNMLKVLPFYGQIDQLQNMDEDPSIFSVFNQNNLK